MEIFITIWLLIGFVTTWCVYHGILKECYEVKEQGHGYSDYITITVDKDSIINSYPLENIK